MTDTRIHPKMYTSGWAARIHPVLNAYLGMIGRQTVAGRIIDPHGDLKAREQGKRRFDGALKSKSES